MNIYTVPQLVSIARSGSKFYYDLYKNLPLRDYALTDIPIATFDKVMSAVHANFNDLFSSNEEYGMCYTTSGTTGKAKATMFGRDEWRTTNELLAITHWKNGVIHDGATICNISEPGSASFMAIHRVVDSFPGRCSEIPIGGDASYEQIYNVMTAFGADIVAGMNPTILGLAESIVRQGSSLKDIKRLLGGGELLYGAQLDIIRQAFPNATISSFLYGSTEAGLMGYGDLETSPSQIKIFDQICKIELVDPLTHKVIDEYGIPGLVVATNLVRVAAPAIRMDTGDMAVWIPGSQGCGRMLELRGRLFPFKHKLLNAAIDASEVANLVDKLCTTLRISKFQLEIRGTEEEPRIHCVLSLNRQVISEAEVKAYILDGFFSTIPAIGRLLQEGRLGDLTVELVDFSYFELQTKRKGRFIVDKRI